jgi:hypothetical protein
MRAKDCSGWAGQFLGSCRAAVRRSGTHATLRTPELSLLCWRCCCISEGKHASTSATSMMTGLSSVMIEALLICNGNHASKAVCHYKFGGSSMMWCQRCNGLAFVSRMQCCPRKVPSTKSSVSSADDSKFQTLTFRPMQSCLHIEPIVLPPSESKGTETNYNSTEPSDAIMERLPQRNSPFHFLFRRGKRRPRAEKVKTGARLRMCLGPGWSNFHDYASRTERSSRWSSSIERVSSYTCMLTTQVTSMYTPRHV